MSSMSAIYGAVGPSDRSNSTSNTTCQDAAAYGCKRWNTSETYFNSGLPTPPGSRAMPGVVLGNSYAALPAPPLQQGRSGLPDGANATRPRITPSTVSTNHAYALAPPANGVSLYNRRAPDHNNVNAIAPHLQIPESVNKSKGSLAEFAAEITCLFWFETGNTLQYAENLPEDVAVDRGLLPDAVPTIGFRKWVTTIISTTQVGKNVILLALLFIYRLKRFNPSVSGKRGSEFRLLTIALMLGNKFLDDNTYTNKTWAEVSGISVTEIHIMEVEFLSNMRYALYASAEEWSEWKSKLGRFGAFYDKASELPLVDESRANGATPVTPTAQSFPQKLPSPPSTHHSASPYGVSPSLNSHYPVLPHPSTAVTQFPSSPLRQQVGLRGYQQERKRSADYSAELPPAKRQQLPGQLSENIGGRGHSLPYIPGSLRVSPTHPTGVADIGVPAPMLDIPRLDMPRPPPSLPLSNAPPTLLPVQTNRPLSTVYPPATGTYSHPVTPISAVPQSLFQNPVPSLGDGSRSITTLPSAHTSPSNGYNTTTPTLAGLSPSYFLTHRTSPYRPVRHVNTLLIPPPSAALQMPVRNIPSDQIHYHPLSKATTERRTGLLPNFHPDGWQHSNVSTPITQHQYPF
ncbi:uncharacterized protein PV07_00624 [Cladophialophora immunda]|uniref:Cyclin N-terminal domain-containing protein n=1 Tax=Cladophialophora immunda TaxID=569365 RepID=A0A0D2B838_9EURO|nr:uncharacterized protein PV07_00624 [Cladophialophora immunda]KIW33802.1 hypothetical protein PV07_00624 [Cladophialophora immunda]OQU94313.1 hypothetical protein CLAIMM_00679 [Cladophialophora immunda]